MRSWNSQQGGGGGGGGRGHMTGGWVELHSEFKMEEIYMKVKPSKGGGCGVYSF